MQTKQSTSGSIFLYICMANFEANNFHPDCIDNIIYTLIFTTSLFNQVNKTTNKRQALSAGVVIECTIEID